MTTQGYAISVLLYIGKETTESALDGTLIRREDDTTDVSRLGEIGIPELNGTGLCRTKKLQTKQAGLIENGLTYLLTTNMIEYRRPDFATCTDRGLNVLTTIRNHLNRRWPANKIESKTAENMMVQVGGLRKHNKPSRGLIEASEDKAFLNNLLSETRARLAASEQQTEDLQRQLGTLRAAEVRREQAQLSQPALARTQSMPEPMNAPFTPARLKNPAGTIPTPESPTPRPSRHRSRAAPTTPTRPGPSSSHRSLGSPIREDEPMDVFNDDVPVPDVDGLPQTARPVAPASPPPTPGPSNTNIHAHCEERIRDLEQAKDQAVSIAQQAAHVLGAGAIQNLIRLFGGGGSSSS
ncbi:unnamed protein product [Peniophora sp. CBMAI 1063]|nr:unnamed protein product [Peniophora sp. CBMAI 1063]